MSQADFSAYLREYEAEGVGTLLYSLIYDVVRQTAIRYPPAIYSPDGVWDAGALAGICHDFTLDKLLRAGRLEYYLLTQDTLPGLRTALLHDFRYYLINRKQRSESQNLYTRVTRLLAEDPAFALCGGALPSVAAAWGLTGWTVQATAERLDEVTRAMFGVPLPPLVRYRADSAKLSHLLSTDDLRRLLRETFARMGQCIRVDLLMEALRYRLGLFEATTTSLDAPLSAAQQRTAADLVADPAEVGMEVGAHQIAQDLFDRLSDRQRAALALRLTPAEPTLEQIGQWLQTSKSTVYNDINLIVQAIRATQVSQQEAELILGYLAQASRAYVQAQFGELASRL